jgi:hypothetical protein
VSSVLHIINDLHKASPAELVAYTIAGDQVIEHAPADVDPYLWATAAMILIEADAAPHLAHRSDLFHRGHVTLVGHDPHDQLLWIRAQQVGAQKIIFLPQAVDWLITEIRGTCHPQTTT